MSDDDDRMDRARRIRRMREGDDDRSEDGSEQDPPAERDSSGESPDSGDSSPDDGGTADGGEASVGSSAAGAAMAVEQTAGGETDGLKAPLPGAEQLEDALDGTDAESEAETVTPDVADAGDADGAEAEQRQEETRVLEFTLQDEHYCLDIEYIEEIVKKATITRVPNTPAFVEGVVDLRGQITTILNPKVTIGKEQRAAGELIVVFDDEAFEDQGHVGWVVDDVRQVSLITEDDVNEPPMDDDHINGVIDRDEEDEFVIWTTPNLVLDEAE